LLALVQYSTAFVYAQCPDGTVASEENLVKNGDFSQGYQSFQTDYTFSLDYSSNNNFLDEGEFSIVPNPQFVHQHFATCRDHSNTTSSMMVINASNKPNQAVWKQTVKVQPKTYYYFSTWICNAVPASPSRLAFAINNGPLGDPIVAPMEVCLWKQFYSVWYSGNATEANISIVNQNLDLGGNDFALDDIVFYACRSLNLGEELKAAKVGSTIELRNILFDNAKWDIKPESNTQLETLLQYLKKNARTEIEVNGHTDNVGNDNDNLTLSDNRAKAVYDYLIQKGISKSRLSYKGFGETKPIANNETIEGRQRNRRVEFVIRRM